MDAPNEPRATMTADIARRQIRVDLQVVADMIEPGSRVLDVGCGDGELLDYLVHEKNVDGRGVEISVAGVNACVSAGLSVVQGDADTDLRDYPDGAFDYAILSQTLQATRNPRTVLGELLRIGKRAVVSFPNFGHWQIRLKLMFGGRMPKTKILGYEWYETPNIHHCSIRDFVALCAETGITIERSVSLDSYGAARRIGAHLPFRNLFGEQAVFLLRRKD
jgi:methionine biosynthesis protein MetW